MSARAVLFDWDGVLIDSAALYVELFQELCRRYRKPWTVTDFGEWYQAAWEECFQDLGFSPQEYLEASTLYPQLLDYRQASFFPALPPLIKRLHGRWPLGVVSTAPTPLIEERLRQEGLLDRFALVVGSDDASTEKRRRVGAVLKQLGARSGVMVGDTDLDIDAGRANGLATVGVTFGWLSARRVRAARPTCLVDAPEQLEKALLALLE